MSNVMSITLNLYQNLCRICLEETNDGYNLLSGQVHSIDILRKIYICFHKTLDLNNNLPSRICRSCTEELNVCDRFRLKCVSFKERFKKLCETRRITEDVTDDADEFFDNLSEYETKSNILQARPPYEYEDTRDHSIQSEENILHDISCALKPKINKQIALKAHNKDSDASFICEACNKVLKTQTSLLKHIIHMHKNRKSVGKTIGFGAERRFLCTKCTFSSLYKSSLIIHLRNHDGQRPYKCNCGKSFTQKSSLIIHKRIHSDDTYHTCSTCGKQFKYAYSFQRHLKVHTITVKFPCTICPKQLKSSQSLKEHMNRHFNIRNYNCEDCADTFVSSSGLISHRNNKHNDGEMMKCPICEKYKTNNKRKLNMHLNRHSGYKAFQCDICSKSFLTKNELTCHKRAHTKEKPYQCPTCAQRFTHSSSLNKHMKTVHGVNFKWSEAKVQQLKQTDTNVSSVKL